MRRRETPRLDGDNTTVPDSAQHGPRRANQSMAIEYVATALLKPDPKPQRKHGQRQLANLTGAISRFDVVRPLLVTDDNVVLDGNAVLEVAKRLGHETIPVIRVSGFTPNELRALQMSLNRIGESAEWDEAVLKADFIALLEDPDFEYSLDFSGFDAVMIDRVTLAADPLSDQDEIPLVDDNEVVTRAGDIWLCGPHVIACGDSRQGGVYEQILGGLQVRMSFSDVPYNVKIQGNVSGLGKTKHNEFAMASGEMSKTQFIDFQRVVFEHCRQHSVDGALAYFFIDWRHVADQIAAGEQVFGALKQMIVWDKGQGAMGQFYRSQHELLTIWKVGEAPHVNNFGLGGTGRLRTNVWSHPGYSSLGAGREEALASHPTCKPLPLIIEAILDVTRPGEVVLDPFGGSGTTLIAAERTSRIARVIEIEPKYVDVTLQRFVAETSEEPVLAESGEAFSAVQSRRQSETAKPVSDLLDDAAWAIL